MAQSIPLVLRLLASSVTAATRGGKIIRDVMSRGDLGIVEKGLNDLQTEADRSAERCIVASLTQQYPNLTIIGEEGATHSEVPSDWIVTDYDKGVIAHPCPAEYADVTNDDIVVWVDPLDGTSEYTQGLVEHVTVLVGLSVRGRAVGGVIHQPFFGSRSGDAPGRTIWGLVGLGVGGFTPAPPPPEKLIVTTTRSHQDATVLKAIEALRADEVIKVGGAGHKVLLLLEGKAHVYVFAGRGTKKWDTCAPEAILKAMGGRLTDFHGNGYRYEANVPHPNVGGVFATVCGLGHDELLAKIPDDVKGKLK